MSEKQTYVVSLLKKYNVNMPTRDIITIYNEKNKDSISERHVQRIRKWYKANNESPQPDIEIPHNIYNADIEIPHNIYNDHGIVEKDVFDTANMKGESNMNQKDVFDASTGMYDWQIEVLNMANEGGWSVQQISEKVDKPETEVRDTLTNFHYMVHNQILDENSDNPYFNNKIPDSLLPDVPNRYFDEIEEEEKSPADPAVNKSASNDDYWEVKIDCVDACGKVKKFIDVYMNKIARDKSMRFMKWAKANEWLAYLIGENKDGNYYVYDLHLPDQRTSATLVDKVVAENYNQLSVIGVMHSHHEMGAGDVDSPSFSGHDTEFINSNHNLSLLAGKNGSGFKIVGIARVKTPCDALVTVRANVKPMFEEPTEEESALKNEFFKKVFDKSPKKNKKNDQWVGNKGDGYHFTDNPTINRS